MYLYDGFSSIVQCSDRCAWSLHDYTLTMTSFYFKQSWKILDFENFTIVRKRTAWNSVYVNRYFTSDNVSIGSDRIARQETKLWTHKHLFKSSKSRSETRATGWIYKVIGLTAGDMVGLQ